MAATFDDFFGRVKREVVLIFVAICACAHNLRRCVVDHVRTLELFFISSLGCSPTSGVTRSNIFMWNMRPSSSMTMSGPRKIIEPQFLYVPYITGVIPEGDVEEECERWHYGLITASEAEELQLSKMDCE